MSARPLWTAAEAEFATAGRSSADWTARGVSIDSRTLKPDDLFVALKGPQFDGHDYLAGVFEADAAAAMVHREDDDLPADLPAAAPLLRVKDTLRGLRDLGAAARTRSQARFVGVTGSVGKTGTKEALRVCLAASAPTAANEGSLNNHWGVPLSLARMAPDAVYGVFELGMNSPGEIAALSSLVRPHVALIINVEPAHIAFFESVIEIAEAKAEIFGAMETDGIAVLNRDHALFHLLRDRALAAGITNIIGFGHHPEADARALGHELEETGSRVRASILGREIEYRVSLPGRHWVSNSLAVLATVAALEADLEKAADSLGKLAPLRGRGERRDLKVPGGACTLIDDSYNANPTSMRAAFQVLAATRVGAGGVGGSGRRIAVLGDMLELGAAAPALHARLAAPLRSHGIDLVFTCGEAMSALHKALPKAMRGGHAADSSALTPLVTEALRPGDVVLVKGSLGSRMGPLVRALSAIDPATEGAPPRAANGE